MGESVLRWKTTAESKQCVGLRPPTVGRGIGWVARDRLLERRDAFVESILGSLVEVLTAPQVTLVSLRIDRRLGCQTRPILRGEIQLDLLNNIPSDFFLHFENALVFLLVFACPNVLVRGSTNQLGMDTDLVSLLHQGPFHNRFDREHPRNLWH